MADRFAADPAIHERVRVDREEALPDAKEVKDYRNYSRGRQKNTLTEQQAEVLRSVTDNRFADNVCAKILAEAANRHELTGWAVPDEAVAEHLDGLWTRNHLPDLAGDVHHATLRDGNHAVALRWRDGPTGPAGGRVTLHRERWWDGESGLFVAYDDAREPVYAVKDWAITVDRQRRTRRVIWWPDKIERWVSEGGGWGPFALAGEPGPVLPWVRPDGRALGIPVVHFGNGSDDDAPYGASELDGGVLGFQDELNDLQRDLTAACRLLGFPMLITSGGPLPTDAAGNPVPFVVGPGRNIHHDSKDFRAEASLPGDLSQIERAYYLKLQAVARMTSTPLHLITGGDWPSGEALLRAELPLIAKVERQQRGFSPAWATVAHRATELANAFDGAGLDEDALIEAEWGDAAKLDEATRIAVALQLAALTGPQHAMRHYGLSEEEVERVLAERAQAAERQRALFDEGLAALGEEAA